MTADKTKTCLIKNIDYIVSCDDQDRVYQGASIYIEDGLIKSIGQEQILADQVIDGRG